jgi:hypothetical protein
MLVLGAISHVGAAFYALAGNTAVTLLCRCYTRSGMLHWTSARAEPAPAIPITMRGAARNDR